MQKKILMGLAAAMLLTACSQDETIDSIVNDSDVIKVGVNVAGTSRAANSYCNDILPTGFKLSALHSGKDAPNAGIYFKDAEMNVNASSRTASFADGSNRYWPDNELSFFAWHTTQEGVEANYVYNAEDSTATVSIENFTVNPDVDKQEDLIYAIANVKKGENVALDFSHALCQVVFSGKCENTSIVVNVKEVGFTGLFGTGSFQAGFEEKEEAESNIRDTDMAENMQSWQKPVAPKRNEINRAGDDAAGTEVYGYGWVKNENSVCDQEYMISLGDGITLSENVTPLTAAPANHAPEVNEETGELDWSNWSQVMQLIPQYSGVLQLLGAPARRAQIIGNLTVDDSGNKGLQVMKPYLKVRCDILAPNVKKEGQDQTYASIFSSTNEAGEPQYLYIPIGLAWKPGYRYVYTLNFAHKGNGGYIDPEDPNPETVLKNINVKVTVNEYDDKTIPAQEVSAEKNNLDELVNMPR